VVGGAAETDVAHQVDELAEPLLVEAGARVVLGQHALEGRIVALDGGHRVVHESADGWLRRIAFEVRPARLLGHPEDADGAILVGVLGIGALGPLGVQLGVLGLEGVRDVLEEDQAEDDVLVLGGVHVVAEGIRRLPQLGLEAQVGAGIWLARTSRGSLPPRHRSPPRRFTCSRHRIGHGCARRHRHCRRFDVARRVRSAAGLRGITGARAPAT
jgi:hypothetical protein